MLLYLLRHGIAEDHGPEGTDASRRLTPEGVEKTRRAMIGLARLIEPPDLILTSPKVRARQTAEIAAKSLGGELRVWDLLACEKPAAIAAGLVGYGVESLMLVGHEPTLGELVVRLATGGQSGRVEMKKAGCACLRSGVREGSVGGELLWLATPKMLGMLG